MFLIVFGCSTLLNTKHKFILKKEQDLFKKRTYVIYQLLQAK